MRRPRWPFTPLGNAGLLWLLLAVGGVWLLLRMSEPIQMTPPPAPPVRHIEPIGDVAPV